MILPIDFEFPIGSRTVSKIKVDEVLVSDSRLGRQPSKVRYRILIDSNRYLLLELRSIGIPHRFRKVVFLSHIISYSGFVRA